MKRVNDLYDICCRDDNLYQAYLTARKGKRSKRNCFAFERNLGTNLLQLGAELRSGAYRPQPYFSFIIHEAKPRLIQAPAFRDTVAQHAFYRHIYPLFDRRFIATSFACRVGKGTHACADYVQTAMRQSARDSYTLHLDVRRFFYSINRDLLRGLLARVIKDERLLAAMMQYADQEEPLGIPIGNLLSQLFALVYLNPVDHFVKRELRIQHYARYVDDLVLIGLTRQDAEDAQTAVAEYLSTRLELTLSKSRLAPIHHGLNFVGYRTWASRRFVRRRSLHLFGRRLRRARTANRHDLDSLNSLMGHARHTSTHRHYCRRITCERPDLIPYLPHYEARS
jgi:retron-type reverse transcriptase